MFVRRDAIGRILRSPLRARTGECTAPSGRHNGGGFFMQFNRARSWESYPAMPEQGIRVLCREE